MAKAIFQQSGSDEGVTCLDASTGAQNWRKTDIDSTMLDVGPIVYRDKVFAVSEESVQSGTEAKFHCYDLETGSKLWGYQNNTTIFTDFILVSDNLIFVDGNGDIVSINIEDGSEKWRYNISSSRLHGVYYNNNNVFIQEKDNNNLYSFDLQAENINWEISTSDITHDGLTGYEDTIIFGDGSKIVSYNSLGNLEWETGISINATPVVVNDKVYTENGSEIFGLNAENGSIEWSSSSSSFSDGEMAYGSSSLYGTANSTLTAFDIENKSEKWSVSLSGGSSEPTYYNGSVYVSDPNKYLSVNAEDGSENWRVSSPTDNLSVFVPSTISENGKSVDSLIKYATKGQIGRLIEEFIFEKGLSVKLGGAISNDYVKQEGVNISDTGDSKFSFISGNGLGLERLITDFENGLGVFDRVDGNPEIVSNPVFSQSKSLLIDSRDIVVSSKDGGQLKPYPEVGDEVTYYQYYDDYGPELTFVFGQTDSIIDNQDSFGTKAGYNVEVSTGSDGLNLFLQNESGDSDQSQADITYPIGEWVRVVVKWMGAGHYSATVYDKNDNQLASTELNGSAYTQTEQGGMTFYTNNGTNKGYFDYVKITG